MVDCLGNEVVDGDLIIFAATSGRSAIVKMAIVLSAEKKHVHSVEWWQKWINVSSKPGTLIHDNKTLKISEDMIHSAEAQEALTNLRAKIAEGAE